MQHKVPLHPTAMVKWRQRVGSEKLAELMRETIDVARRGKHVTDHELSHVNVDTTVQEKNIAHPTDSKLLLHAITKLAAAAKDRGIPLRQSYVRVAKRVAAEARLRGVVEGGDAVLTVLRYVERNPVRAGLTTAAEAWPWSSAHWWAQPDAAPAFWRRDWFGRPEGWLDWVNRPQTEDELTALRRCVQRGRPFGRDQWVKQMAAEWDLESTLRPRGRPKKYKKK